MSVTIIGAGLAGTLLAITLARQGIHVDLYERRPDPRQVSGSAGRSINLAISIRGLHALAEVGLRDKVNDLLVPMYGRMVHSTTGQLDFHAYGKDRSEHQNSISRAMLNRLLLDAVSTYPSVQLHFSHTLLHVDFVKQQLYFYDNNQQQQHLREFNCVIGADGTSSALAQAMQQQGYINRDQQPLGHSYKELCIPPVADHLLQHHYLHIWPRQDYMLIALPNQDGSFTGTLFLATEAAAPTPSFASLTHTKHVTDFFTQQFADVLPLMPTLLTDFFSHPTATLGTVYCAPWHVPGKALLLGDAAHAVVPFLGQGMNCAFEDCSVFAACFAQHGTNWAALFADFYQQRKVNADAIAHMALANYAEMRHHVADANFRLRKQVEAILLRDYPNQYLSQYHLVAFHRVPYAYAAYCGQLQNELLTEITHNITHIDAIDWQQHRARIEDYLRATRQPLAAMHNTRD